MTKHLSLLPGKYIDASWNVLKEISNKVNINEDEEKEEDD